MTDNKNRQAYAEAQLDLATECYKKGEREKAIEYLKKIKREDDKDCYARAQNNLGLVYDEQGDATKAIEHWGNIRRDDNKRLYARAQFNLAVIYDEQGNATKAIEYYTNVHREDDKEAYAKAQFNLGLLYDEQGNAIKTVEHCSNIHCEDNKEVYAEAQFCLGSNCYIKNELDKAKEYVNEAFVQQESNFLKASILLDKIVILQTYVKDKKGEEYKALKESLEQIDNHTYHILNSLIIRRKEGDKDAERKVATYTQIEVARKLIENETESFRLNIVNRMNDRMEGKTLLNFMGYKEEVASTESIYGFSTCFTFNHNSLNQFRLYGKTNDVEGSGVSFVVSTAMFSDEHSDDCIKLNANTQMADITGSDVPENNAEQNNLINKPIPLYRCIYLNPENGYISLARRSRHSFFLEHGDLEDQAKAEA